MKLLLVLLAILFGIWLWRSGRNASNRNKHPDPKASPPGAPTKQAQDMLACKLCRLHVPQAEALIGPKGAYCCAEHQRRAEA